MTDIVTNLSLPSQGVFKFQIVNQILNGLVVSKALEAKFTTYDKGWKWFFNDHLHPKWFFLMDDPLEWSYSITVVVN